MIFHEVWSTEVDRDKILILEIRNGLRVVFVRSPETGQTWHRKGRGRTQEEAIQAAKDARELPSSITPRMIPVRENTYAEGREPRE